MKINNHIRWPYWNKQRHSSRSTCCPILSKLYVNWPLENDHTAVLSCPVLSCPHCMSTECYRITTQLSCPVQTVCKQMVREWPNSCPGLSTMYVNLLIENDNKDVLSCHFNTVCQLTVTERPQTCTVLSKLYVNWLLKNDHTAVLNCAKIMSNTCYRMTTQLSCPVHTVGQLTVTE